jgi:hypothetical protein
MRFRPKRVLLQIGRATTTAAVLDCIHRPYRAYSVPVDRYDDSETSCINRRVTGIFVCDGGISLSFLSSTEPNAGLIQALRLRSRRSYRVASVSVGPAEAALPISVKARKCLHLQGRRGTASSNPISDQEMERLIHMHATPGVRVCCRPR